eukprot:jgi/Antlo1/1906/2389
MVLGFLKSILLREKQVVGDLYQSEKLVLESCKMLSSDDKLLFASNKDERYFPLKNVRKLALDDAVLRFLSGDVPMRFIVQEKLKKQLESAFHQLHPLTSARPLFDDRSVSFAIFEPERAAFGSARKTRVMIVEDEDKKFLRVEDADDILYFGEIRSDTQHYADQENLSFVWSERQNEGFSTFSLRFGDSLAFLDFVAHHVRSKYRSASGEGNRDSEKYFERMEVENYCSLSSEEDTSLSTVSEEDAPWNDEESVKKTDEDVKNNYLVVGPNNRAFVARGSSVGVFKSDADQLEFQTTIKNVDEHAQMRKMITHDNGNTLLFTSDNDRTRMKKLDLSRGEVVETWDFGRPVNDYFDSNKLIDNGTLVAIDDSSLFRIDPRTKEKVTCEGKKYKTKNEFSCGMATKAGHVAVASRKGDLRLYDKIDKRAKSLLPGFGDEIKGIDITTNGKYVICTCKSYLMLLSVNEDYGVPLGKAKPVPKRLQLKPEHLAFINEEVNFTPAKFSTDLFEEQVVTSTGHYVVSWSLRDVLRGKLYAYTIKKYGDTVVADSFGFGENNTIIVTLPDDVRSVGTERLRDMDREMHRRTSREK